LVRDWAADGLENYVWVTHGVDPLGGFAPSRARGFRRRALALGSKFQKFLNTGFHVVDRVRA